MSKVMVVEDDAALREIYSIRITAEGYDVVSAGDGEEALAVAVREKPNLILSDVMMPKISGFDMLDILRNTPETAQIKVIMMTALSADDQRARGERLGADRYLVKSQVGIEDVVNAIHDVLGDRAAPSPMPAAMGAGVPVAGMPVPNMAGAPAQAMPMAAPAAPNMAAQPMMMPQPAMAPIAAPAAAPTAAGMPAAPVQPPVQPQPQVNYGTAPAQK